MARKKPKLDEDNRNNDQVPKPMTSASNAMRRKANTREESKDNHPLNTAQPQPEGFDSNQPASVAPSDQLLPRLDSLNQPRSGSDSGFNQATSCQLPPQVATPNQPGSISSSAFNQAPLYKLPIRFDSLNQLGSGSNSGFNPTNQPGASSSSGIDRVPLHQLRPHGGFLNQPRLISSSGFDRAPLHQLRPHTGFLNQPRLISNSGVDCVPLQKLQPHGNYLIHVGSIRNPGFPQAPPYQLRPPFESAHQPGSSSNPAFNRDAAYQLQQYQPCIPNVNQLGFVPPYSGQQWNHISRSSEVQQNPLPPCSCSQRPHTQLMNPQVSDSKLKDYLEHRDSLIALCQLLESELSAVNQLILLSQQRPKLTVQATERSPSTDVLLTPAYQGGETRNQVQGINAELNNLTQSQPRQVFIQRPKLPVQATERSPSTDVLLTPAYQGGETRNQVQGINAELNNLTHSQPRQVFIQRPKLTVQATERSPSTDVLLTPAYQGGDEKRNQVQGINAELNKLTQSQPGQVFIQGGRSPSGNEEQLRRDGGNKAEFGNRTGNGPRSTSGKITAYDESNRLVISTERQVLTATDADETISSTGSNEVPGYEKNADASHKGNTG